MSHLLEGLVLPKANTTEMRQGRWLGSLSERSKVRLEALWQFSWFLNWIRMHLDMKGIKNTFYPAMKCLPFNSQMRSFSSEKINLTKLWAKQVSRNKLYPTHYIHHCKVKGSLCQYTAKIKHSSLKNLNKILYVKTWNHKALSSRFFHQNFHLADFPPW